MFPSLARRGADAFYTGEIAINTAAGLFGHFLGASALQFMLAPIAAYARGGILTPYDLANYSAIIRTPANISENTFDGHLRWLRNCP